MYVPSQSVVSFHTESELHVDHAVYTLLVIIGFYALVLAVALGFLFVVRSYMPHLRLNYYIAFTILVPILVVTFVSTAIQVRAYDTIHQDCNEFDRVADVARTKIPAIIATIATCDIQGIIQQDYNDNNRNGVPSTLIDVLNYVQDQYESMYETIRDAMTDTINVVYQLQTSFIVPFMCMFAFSCVALIMWQPSRKWLPVLLLAWAISAILLVVVQTLANACMAPSESVITTYDLTSPLVQYYIRCAMNPEIGVTPLKVEMAFLKYVSTLNLTKNACKGPEIISGLIDFVESADCSAFTIPMRDAVTTLCTDVYMAYMLMYISVTSIFSIMVIVMI